VHCAACGNENPTVANFCQQCGQKLKTTCAGCGSELSPRARFCHECGQRQAEPAAPTPAEPAAPAEPRQLAEGRYELRRLIGEGAKKRVHLAYDDRLDREVALALIKMDGLDEAGRLRVRREAQAMGRLGDHPNIVTVHDIGEDGGQLYIVSEYMSGGDLEDALGAAGESRRLPEDQALRIASELCGALGHAHAHGVVHRDVKPGNIWIAADGSARLGDFGLAVSVDRTRLTQEGMMVGTVAYMAPEQALGRAPDARSDLYSLGATLYEMLTGRPPFLGDDAVAIISQHIHTAPVAPSWHNPEIPPRLEALVLELLEKDAAARPNGAAALAAGLERVQSGSAETARAPEPVALNPLDRLASGVFVGREDPLDRLRAGVDQALSGHGNVLLLVGEPGIGKTRTSEELVTYARMRGAQALWGRCYEGEGAPPYWPWMQIIRSYVVDGEPQTLMSEMGPGAADIAEIVSEVRERLPGLPTPPKLAPEEARFRLFDSITTFLRNASQRQPLVLVLDDLHWADKPTLLLLEFLVNELEGTRILVLGTYRDVDISRQHPLEQTLAVLARSQTGDRVLLRGLTDEDVGRFLELTSGRTPPGALVDAVFRETEGNPFFVHEVVRLLQSDGRLDQPEDVTSWSVEIPQGVRQVVGRRLDGLSEACNRVLTVGSVIGREFDLRVLAAAGEIGEDTALELLEEAEDARILAEVTGTPGTYRFSHALIRETLYDEVRTTRRVRLHRRIAGVLDEHYAEHPEPHLAELAYHYCEAAPGGDVDKAVEYAERAARRATDAVAYEEAAVHYDRALAALEAREPLDETRACELLLAGAQELFRSGAAEASAERYHRAIEVARRIGSALHLAVGVIGWIEVMMVSASDPEKQAAIEEALEKIGNEYPAIRGRLLLRLAGQLMWMGDPDRVRAIAEEGVALIDAADRRDIDAVTESLSLQNMLLLERHQVEERLAAANRVAEFAREVGDVRREMGAIGLTVAQYAERFDAPSRMEQLAYYRRLGDEVRQPDASALVGNAEAAAALEQGRLADARAHAWSARQHGMRVTPERTVQFYGLQIWALRRFQGRLAETEETLLAGIERYPGSLMWRCLLVCTYAELGRSEPARREIDGYASRDFAELRTDPLLGSDLYALLSDACFAIDYADPAQRLYELLTPMEPYLAMLGLQAAQGAGARHLGNLATLQGRFDVAQGHFESAIENETRAGSLGWLPRTQHDLARMLLTRDASGDRDRAQGLLAQAMETSQELGLKAWLDLCLETKLAAQGVDSGTVAATGTIDAIAASIGARRPDLSLHSAPDGTVTLMFSDMQGFTPMTERLGDFRAREVIRDHNRIVREQVAAHGGHEVELQGDGFLLAFGSARRGLHCAVAIQRAFRAYNGEHSDEPILVRIGLHTGEALREKDKFFGLSVILAARIAAQAQGGHILVSSLVKQLTESGGDIRFGVGRQVSLKGISESQALHSVEWQ